MIARNAPSSGSLRAVRRSVVALLNRRVRLAFWNGAQRGERSGGLPPGLRRRALMKHHRIDLVVDVGANTGIYGQELRSYGYFGRIISFEPTSAAYAALAASSAHDDNWDAYNLALGASSGTFTINVAANDALSSSFLPRRTEHGASLESQRYVGAEEVTRVTLDEFADSHRALMSGRALVKLDVQGYELEVLRGAVSFLEHVQLIEVELSLFSLYEGQPDYREVIDMLALQGFVPWALNPGYTVYPSGRVLEVDGIFAREQAIA